MSSDIPKLHALQAAQEALAQRGRDAQVVDVRRYKRDAVITIAGGEEIVVQGFLAIKLLKLLTPGYRNRKEKKWPSTPK